MNARELRAGLVVGLCLALLAAPSAQGATLWEATAEPNNFSEWSLLQVADPSRATTPATNPRR